MLGNGVGAVADAAARLDGVTQVLTLRSAANAHPLAAVLAPQLAAVAGDYTHVLAPSTTFGKDLLPRLAALLDVPAISDVMAVESPSRFRRPIYAGNAILTVDAGDLRPICCHGAHRFVRSRGAGAGAGASIAAADVAAPRGDAIRASCRCPRRPATGRICRPRGASCPADARWAAPRNSS